MFLVASRVAWRRVTVQCNRFIHRESHRRLQNCDENLYTRIRKRDLQKLTQVRLFNDKLNDEFKVEIKVKVILHMQLNSHVILTITWSYIGKHLYRTKLSLALTNCSITSVRILDSPWVIHCIISLIHCSWNHRYSKFILLHSYFLVWLPDNHLLA